MATMAADTELVSLSDMVEAPRLIGEGRSISIEEVSVGKGTEEKGVVGSMRSGVESKGFAFRWTIALLICCALSVWTGCTSNENGITDSIPETYTISGTVSGAVTGGVTITLTGADSSSTTTDSSGDYSFAF